MPSESKKIEYADTLRNKRVSLMSGRKHSFTILRDTMGQIYFVLYTEMAVDVWPNRDFILRGQGINLSNQTDDKGEFQYAPVEFCNSGS